MVNGAVDDVAGHGIECPGCHTVFFVESAANRSRMYRRKDVWMLLCNCGKQVSFGKHDPRWYQAPAITSKKGYAVQGEWQEVILPRIREQVAFGMAKRSLPSSADKGEHD